MYKVRGIVQSYLDRAFRLIDVKLCDAALFVLSLTLLVLRGPVTALAWTAFGFAAREAARYAVKRCDARRPALHMLIQKAAPLSESVILAFGFAWASLGPSAAAPIVALIVLLGLLGFRLFSRAAHSSRIAAAPLATYVPLLAAIAYLRGEGLAACLLLTGAAFCSLGFLLFQARTHWRRDQLEHAFLAQALMQQDSVAHAVWRLDFRSRTMSGGERFNALIGRDLHFSDIASDLFGADQDERDLAAAVFAPAHGRARTFFITHRALGAGGRSVRLTHRAFLQTGLLGRPLALVCITSAAEQPAHMPVSEQWKALRAHYGEASPFDGQAQAPLSQEHRARA